MDTILTTLILSFVQREAITRWFAPFVEDGATPLPEGEFRALVLAGHIADGVAQPRPVGFGYDPSHAMDYALDAIGQAVERGCVSGY